jgi:hypothetical protein
VGAATAAADDDDAPDAALGDEPPFAPDARPTAE